MTHKNTKITLKYGYKHFKLLSMNKITIIILMLLPFVAKGQYRTSVTVTDFDNAYLKTKIETNLSALISEFNYACAANRSLNFGGVNIDENAKRSVEMLWRNSPFRCD